MCQTLRLRRDVRHDDPGSIMKNQSVEWKNQLNKGDNIVLAAFGGGFTWGATLVKWEY